MTSSGIALRRSSKAQIAQKRSWSMFGDLLPVWSTTAFWIQWNHYIWEACSANQWDALKTAIPSTSTGQQKCPILHENTQPDVAQPMHQMLNELGYEILPHLPYSSDLSPTDDHFFRHLDNFCRENVSTASQMQKTLSMSLSNPKAWIFTQQE